MGRLRVCGAGLERGHTSFFNTQRFFRMFHRRLFDGNRGITIVTLCGFVLLTAALSGFAFYKGWLKQLFTLRLSRSRRLRWSDLHKTAGIWGLMFRVTMRDGRRHEASFTASPVGTRLPHSMPWPDTAAGVWWVVGSFIALTAGLLLGWLALLARAFRAASPGRPVAVTRG